METCSEAFKCIFIENINNQLKVSPCCYSPAKPTNTIDFQNNEYLNSIRNSWRKGEWPDDCLGCKRDEDAGLTSRRIRSNRWAENNNCLDNEVKLMKMDYWVGDTCNLRCPTCDPVNSSSWKQELKIPIVERKVTVNKFWQDVDLSELIWIHFNGGEPLLNKEHIDLLNNIPNKSNTFVMYNTNGTILPTKELIDTWTKFKIVNLSLSIDDIEDGFEYLRYPAKWETIVNNVEILKSTMPKNVCYTITRVVSILNHQRLHLLDEWVKNTFGEIKIFNQPVASSQLNIDNDPIDNCDYLDELDTRRNTNWRKVFPEIVELLDV